VGRDDRDVHGLQLVRLDRSRLDLRTERRPGRTEDRRANSLDRASRATMNA
jgi:hypothetical protein